MKKPTPMTRYRKYAAQALQAGALEAKIIPVGKVVAAEWVRLKCQFGCSGFGKRLCCPPRTPTPEQMRQVLSDYQRALIYSYTCTPDDYVPRRLRMQQLVPRIERAAFLDGHYKAFGLMAGPCRLCKVCNVKGRCRHSELARPSMESCGIDVYATARRSGIRLDVVTRENATSKFINLILID
jgi:predicted metal-binding protein